MLHLPSLISIDWWKLRSADAPSTKRNDDRQPRIVEADHQIADDAEYRGQHHILDRHVDGIGTGESDAQHDRHQNLRVQQRHV